LGQKFGIIFAGPAFNYLFGLVLFFLLFAFAGRPSQHIAVADVAAGSAAARAGIKSGDEIISVSGESPKDLAAIVRASQGREKLAIRILRGGETLDFAVKPDVKKDGAAVIGIKYSPIAGRYESVDFPSAAGHAFDELANITTKTLGLIGEMITGNRSTKDLGGIITIAQAGGRALDGGIYPFLYLMAFISVSLGFFNLLPIPILDGGYLFIYAIEAAIRRPLPHRVKDILFYAGFAIVILLMLVSNGNDIYRLAK
jgi:regulator of sigma E protease